MALVERKVYDCGVRDNPLHVQLTTPPILPAASICNFVDAMADPSSQKDTEPTKVQQNHKNKKKRRAQKMSQPCRSVSLRCSFCLSNGETKDVYSSHCLKLSGVVQCPILRRYICPICQKTGDDAHTKKYCPTLWEQNQNRHTNRKIRTAYGKQKSFKY